MISHSRPLIDRNTYRSVEDVLASSMLSRNVISTKLKDTLARSSQDRCFLYASGRLAIYSALQSLQIEPGKSVMVQTYVCEAVIWAIEKAGLRPLYCDVSDGWNCSVSDIDKVIHEDVSAIILAPPFGHLQNAQPFRKYGLPIIHDLCQSSPKILNYVDASNFGDVIIFSFHPTKYICSTGGGVALTSDPRISSRLELSELEWMDVAPFSDIQAAIAISQIEAIDFIEKRRASIFERYINTCNPLRTARMLNNSTQKPGLRFRFLIDIQDHSFESLKSKFAQSGIHVRKGVDALMHRCNKLSDDLFPNSIQRYNSTLSVPFYPALSDEEVATVAKSIGSLD